MGLFRRLSTSLFNPSGIKEYAKDKAIYTLLVFFLLQLILIIPHSIQISRLDGLNYKSRSQITNFFLVNEEINFSIKDHRLVNNEDEKQTLYFDYSPEILVVFSNDEENINVGTKVALVFGENYVYIRQNVLRKDLFKYNDYDKLEGLDFSLAKSPLNDDFWNSVFYVINNELTKIKPMIVTSYLLIIFTSNALLIILFSLLIALFQMARLRGLYRFLKVWQLSIYCLVPYVFGSVLSELFNFEILSHIGLFMSIIYGAIMSRSIIREEV